MAVSASRFGGKWTTYLHTISPSEASAKKFTLTTQPKLPSTIVMDILDGGGAAIKGVHFELLGQEIHWDSYELDGALSADDRIRLTYI